MLVTPLTPKSIFIIIILGSLLVLDHGCSQDMSKPLLEPDRHTAAMKDLGKNDYVPVRTPW